jgi:hypothetical protein
LGARRRGGPPRWAGGSCGGQHPDQVADAVGRVVVEEPAADLRGALERAGLDLALAAELRVGGRVPLQVLAGAFEGAARASGRILYDDAPYGVGYLVGVLTAP